MNDRRRRPAASARGAPRTILFAQELGAGYGHTTKLIAIARHFPEVRQVFVSPHPDLARPVIAASLGAKAECFAAPRVAVAYGHPATPEATMAEILDRVGFGDGEAVSRAVAEWDGLLRRHRPDLIVSDYAPTLRIAAADSVPHVVVGDGFSTPPDTSPVLPFREALDGGAEAIDTEARVLLAANAARRAVGRGELPRFASLLQGDRTFVASFPELDPFGERRSEAPIPPFNVPRSAPGPARPERDGPHVFGYLDALAGATSPVLTALNGLARPSRIFVRNIDPHALAPHCAPQVEISVFLADFGELLPRVRLIIHPGAHGTANASLQAGTPQLLFPRSLESELTSERLCALGVAEMLTVSGDADPAAIRAVIERLLDDPALGERARAVARRLWDRGIACPERPVVEACRAVLAGAPG